MINQVLWETFSALSVAYRSMCLIGLLSQCFHNDICQLCDIYIIVMTTRVKCLMFLLFLCCYDDTCQDFDVCIILVLS